MYDLAVTNRGDASGGIVYLCNNNAGKWVPVAMGRRSEGKNIFRKVTGRDLLAVAEADGKAGLEFISDPFLAGPSMERRVSVRFVRNEGITHARYTTGTTAGTSRTFHALQKMTVHGLYGNVPGNALQLNVTDGWEYDSSVRIEKDGVFNSESWL